MKKTNGQIGNRGSPMSGLVSHSVFLWATGIAAVFGGIGIIAAFASAIVGYQLTEEALLDANIKISVARDEAKADADAKIGVAREEARVAVGKAQADIAEAVKQTESAKADAAEANRKAESERLERLKLEAVVAPRSLSLDQQRLLAATWRQFAGKRVAVISYSLDGEGASLATQIMASMAAAGIAIDNRLASVMPMGGFSLGVHVNGSDISVVNGLQFGLRSIGNLIVAPAGSPQGGGASMGVGAPPDASTAPLAAEILVGIKPVATIR